ncbi:hypothetical protein M408DRAFT_219185 [Serendipita vermifera MAFF 305830]|uniref:C2 domain-containing protein n=1 Tax=Serendipita vermifera MAFF 305830 TaxID=933852 RepID=A0A0C3B6J8_SERVB|nr:hypothetical protein M408DRAFT_219185 [Serendipita vermifera MAFF 305830]
MSAVTEPAKQVIDPQQNTDEKQARIMEKQEKRDGQVREPGAPGQSVRDPVTGEQMEIQDAKDIPEEVPPGENVLKMAFPPPDIGGQREYLFSLFNATASRITLAFTLVPIIAFATAPPAFTSRPLFLLIPSLGIPAALSFLWVYRMQSKSEDDADRRVWDVERKRGLQAGYDKDGDGRIEAKEKIKESTEWLNALLGGVWPIINPDMFTSTVDMLEDIMQASVPTFIHSVRIPTLGLGTNPLRITSMRALPDAQLDGVTNALKDEEKEQIQGEHVNYELSFAYRAAPNQGDWNERAQNFHLLVEFYMGIKGVAAVPIPVWAEITGFVGTARMRLELIPNPPFVKHTLITLVGLPKVSISITPIHKKLLPNMMDIPFLSRFISESINAAAKEYVAPKSMMLDLQQLLSGDGINRDTAHIGVIVVHIHQVTVKKDAKQSVSDMNAYVNVCLSPTNKTQYSTRVISGTLEPVFEETTVLLVDANAAKIGEKVSLQLWDSDRFTADDMIGHVDIDVAEVMSKHNTAVRRVVPMQEPLSSKESGTMEFTLGFYSKVTPGCNESTSEIPQQILDSDGYKKARKSTLTDLEAAVAVTPPPEEFLSGILGIQLHEIRELGVKKDNMNSGKGSTEKPEGEQEVESEKGLPSSYCTVMLNDEPVYKTRTKPMTSTPFFNATTERFVKDWKAAHICIVIRDSRMRENDPVMGMVFFKLADLFKDGSMKTGSWSLQHGIGFGRIHLSFVFRPVLLTMPPSLVGFELGTVIVKGVTVKFKDQSLHDSAEVRLATSGGYTKIKKGIPAAAAAHDGDDDAETGKDTHLQLPILTRYHSALVLNARKKGLLRKGTLAMGTVWLRDLVDNHHDGIIRATLWKTDKLQEMKQNYSKPEETVPGVEAESIGEVELKVVFRPGISDVHEKDMREDPSTQRSWEEYVIMKRGGLRKAIGRESGQGQLDLDDLNGVTDNVQQTEAKAINPTESHDSLNGKLKDWTDHQDNLSADHRGIKQFKGVRTAEWMADGIRDAVADAAGRLHRKERTSTMEKEA